MTANTLRQAPQTTGLLWLLAPLWYLLCEAVTAAAFDGYSYAYFYISDLGVAEHGDFEGRMLASQIPEVMNAGFIGSGLLFLLGLCVLWPSLEGGASRWYFLGAGVLHTVGITFVGLVPGSPANATSGLMTIHVAGAISAIVGGNLAAILSHFALRTYLPSAAQRLIGPVLGGLGLLSALLLVLHALVPDGVSERGAVYTFFAWQFLMAIALLRIPRAGASGASAVTSAADHRTASRSRGQRRQR